MKTNLKVKVSREGEVLYGARLGEWDDALLNGLILHEVCMGFVDRKRISETHYAFCCRACGLRIPVPIHVRTWASLKLWADTHLTH